MSHAAEVWLDRDAMSRRGVETRLAFAALTAGLALTFAPWAPLVLWLAVIFVWEFLAAPAATERFIRSIHNRNRNDAMTRQTALSFVGACLYGAFPFLVFPFGAVAGPIMGLAWSGGTAIHVFAYLGNHRSLFIGGLIPPLAGVVVAPILHWGPTHGALIATVSALYLIAAAAAFSFDRNKLLVELTKQSAAREAAELLATAKAQILAVLSHELRTPLNAIINYAEMLAEDIRDGAADATDAERIRAASGDLLKLINRVIEVSRVEAGQIEIECVPTDLPAFLSDIVTELSAAARDNNTTLRLDADSESGQVLIDAVNARRCLVLLGENAAKFTRNGEVTICARARADAIEIAVSDTGVGIAPDAQARLFSVFMQADASAARPHEGLGLGLALAAGLARAMGGEIAVESELNRGSTFVLRLPLRQHASAR